MARTIQLVPPSQVALLRALADCAAVALVATDILPECEVCDDTGDVTGGAGRHGRPILPCQSCDAYDRNQRAIDDGPWA